MHKGKDMEEDYKRMLESALAVGLPVLSMDTCARLLAIIYASNSEVVTHCPKMIADCKYAQKRFHIAGSEVPDAELACLVKSYVCEIERTLEESNELPRWCSEFVRERYGINKLF